jgi:hypothetical protein
MSGPRQKGVVFLVTLQGAEFGGLIGGDAVKTLHQFLYLRLSGDLEVHKKECGHNRGLAS